MIRDGVAVDPIARALWYIESHFAQEITLDDVAAVAGVSRYHLSRTFALATGSGVMAYVRGRRLSEAARAPRLPRAVRPHARRRACARPCHRPSSSGGSSYGRLDAHPS